MALGTEPAGQSPRAVGRKAAERLPNRRAGPKIRYQDGMHLL